MPQTQQRLQPFKSQPRLPPHPVQLQYLTTCTSSPKVVRTSAYSANSSVDSLREWPCLLASLMIFFFGFFAASWLFFMAQTLHPK
jgi:hypothetical protein